MATVLAAAFLHQRFTKQVAPARNGTNEAEEMTEEEVQRDQVTPAALSATVSGEDRLIRLRPGQAYNQLPVDLIQLIAQFLDGRSLGRLSSCDRTSHAVSQKPQLWEYLTQRTELQAEWLDSVAISATSTTMRSLMHREVQRSLLHSYPLHPSITSSARLQYRTRHLVSCRLRHYAQARFTLRRNEFLAHRRMWWMKVVEEMVAPPVIVMLIGWQLLNLVMQLDSSSPQININTFLPSILIYLLLLTSILNLFYIKWRNSFVEDGLWSHFVASTSRPGVDVEDNHSQYHAARVDTTWRFLPESYLISSSASPSSSTSLIHSLTHRILSTASCPMEGLLFHMTFVGMYLAPVMWLCFRQVASENIVPFVSFFLYQVYIISAFSLTRFFLGPRRVGMELKVITAASAMLWQASALNVYNFIGGDILNQYQYFSFHFVLLPLHILQLNILIGIIRRLLTSRQDFTWRDRVKSFLPLPLVVIPIYITLMRIGFRMDGYTGLEILTMSGKWEVLQLSWEHIMHIMQIPIVCAFVWTILAAYRKYRQLQQEEIESTAHRIQEVEELFVHPIKFDEPCEMKRSEWIPWTEVEDEDD